MTRMMVAIRPGCAKCARPRALASGYRMDTIPGSRMAKASQSHARAIRALQRQLVRRRLQWLGARLRLELALIALLLGGFLFWQVRAPFDGLRRAHGPLAVVLVIAIAWLILAVLGASLTAGRHVKSLRSGPAGPAWLALPLEPNVLARHLEWESRTHAL